MNKQDLVDRLAEEHELTGRFAREVVDSVFDIITGVVLKGAEVSLFGL
jgi:DNA-binding protein HU-beta